MWQIWLIISGICFILEIVTVGFLLFWFAIGALFAMISSFITDNITIQMLVFVISSTGLLFLTKPLAKKISTSNTVKTNAYSIIGKTGIVVKEINAKNGLGQVKIGNEIWSATSDDNIPVDTEVEICKIDGVKVIVKTINVAITN